MRTTWIHISSTYHFVVVYVCKCLWHPVVQQWNSKCSHTFFPLSATSSSSSPSSSSSSDKRKRFVLRCRWCTSSDLTSTGRRSPRCTPAACTALRTCPRWPSCTRPPSCTTSSCDIRRTTFTWVAFLNKFFYCSKQKCQNRHLSCLYFYRFIWYMFAPFVVLQSL